eukprot:CAMPEP_0178468654 /NCGR_PEP_ID=MMETSP0689_2-20121128/53028_1 /TAXON_ID=160604 /ORGANISM="Amphidinium massartii, Strain CS-259" /LENGTH=53 /DNA_ID=CAMNT_0020095711 /DNA_START=470 /DNA_END=631 /DNA_ORIENTATION=-
MAISVLSASNATSSGERPLLSGMEGSALASRNAFTIFACPKMTAAANGVALQD